MGAFHDNAVAGIIVEVVVCEPDPNIQPIVSPHTTLGSVLGLKEPPNTVTVHIVAWTNDTVNDSIKTK